MAQVNCSRYQNCRILLAIACISLFVLPLFNAWFLFPLEIQNLQTVYSALFGILPWSDAEGYYNGANYLLENGILDAWNTRRPLNAILLALRLFISNNHFKISLLLQALLCGISCWLASHIISKNFGKKTSIVTFIILFIFASIFIPTTLSETLGLTLGALSFVYLWAAIQNRRSKLLLPAGILLMIGLNTRSGALFILPLLMIWLGFNFNTPNNKKISFNIYPPAMFFFGLLVGVLFNVVITKLYGNTQLGGATHGNFAPILYGLIAGGKGWIHAEKVYPQILAMPETESTRFLFQKSFELFKNSPELLFIGLFKNLWALVKSAMNFFLRLPNNIYLKIFIRISAIIIMITCFFRLKQISKFFKREVSLMAITLLGMFLSAGCIWKDGGFRVFAVTVPFFATALGMMVTSKPFAKTSEFDAKIEIKIATILTILLLCSALIGPYFINHKIYRFDANYKCANNERVIITRNISGAPFINLLQNEEKLKNILKMSALENTIIFLKLFEPKYLSKTPLLGLVYDIKSSKSYYILTTNKIFHSPHTLTGLCARKISDGETVLQINSFGEVRE